MLLQANSHPNYSMQQYTLGASWLKSSFSEEDLWSQGQAEHESAVPALSAKASCILGYISKKAASRPREVILPPVDTCEITSGVLCPVLSSRI